MIRDFVNKTELSDLASASVLFHPRTRERQDKTIERYYMVCVTVPMRDQNGITESVEVEVEADAFVNGGKLFVRTYKTEKDVPRNTLTVAQSRNPDKLKAAIAFVLGLVDNAKFGAV